MKRRLLLLHDSIWNKGQGGLNGGENSLSRRGKLPMRSLAAGSSKRGVAAWKLWACSESRSIAAREAMSPAAGFGSTRSSSLGLRGAPVPALHPTRLEPISQRAENATVALKRKPATRLSRRDVRLANRLRKAQAAASRKGDLPRLLHSYPVARGDVERFYAASCPQYHSHPLPLIHQPSPGSPPRAHLAVSPDETALGAADRGNIQEKPQMTG